MSGVKVIRHMLVTDADVIEAVDPGNIMAGDLPQNTILPAIAIKQISGNRMELIKHTTGDRVADRVQVTALSTTYAQTKQIIKLIKQALPAFYGNANGVSVDSIEQGGVGPDLSNKEPVIHEQSIDYIIKYID